MRFCTNTLLSSDVRGRGDMQTDRSRLLVPFSHVSRQLDRKQCQEETVMRDLERVKLAPNTLRHTSPQTHTELIQVYALVSCYSAF